MLTHVVKCLAKSIYRGVVFLPNSYKQTAVIPFKVGYVYNQRALKNGERTALLLNAGRNLFYETELTLVVCIMSA